MTTLPQFERVISNKNKGLNLFVGLYYTISLKSIPNCYVTYETEPRDGSHLMQVALSNTEDYEVDGILRENALWTILPSGSGDNDYFLKVLSLPHGILTYSHALSWGGRYLELDLTHPEYYKPGQTMHTSSLWHFEPSELPDYFTIHNNDPRRKPNFVTFSNEPSINGQLMQIGTKDIDHYEPKGNFRHDALWTFRPANFILKAKVCNFEYDMPAADVIESASIPIRVTDEITVVNDTDSSHVHVDEAVKLNESFVCCFLQSFKIFQEENVTVECDISNKIPGRSESSEELKYEKVTNTQWCANGEREFPIREKLLLSFQESANITGFCNWVYHVEIPFTATMEIRATSDVAYCPTPVELHRVNADIKECDIIESFLRYERFSGKIVPRSGGMKGDSGIVRCTVSGRIKGSFGVGTKLNVKYL